MPSVLALLALEGSELKLRRALTAASRGRSRPMRLSIEEEITALRARMRREGAGALIIEPEAVDDWGASEELLVPGPVAEILEDRGAPPMAIWAAASWLRPHRVQGLSRQSVADFVVRGEDDPGALARVLRKLLRSKRSEAFLAVLPPDLPDDLVHLVEALLVPSTARRTPDDLARIIYRERSAVFRRAKAVGLPPPRELLGWIRTYFVLHLHDSGEEWPSAAIRVGFESSDAFWVTARQRLGVASRDDVRIAGWEGTLDALARRIAERRAGRKVGAS